MISSPPDWVTSRWLTLPFLRTLLMLLMILKLLTILKMWILMAVLMSVAAFITWLQGYSLGRSTSRLLSLVTPIFLMEDLSLVLVEEKFYVQCVVKSTLDQFFDYGLMDYFLIKLNIIRIWYWKFKIDGLFILEQPFCDIEWKIMMISDIIKWLLIWFLSEKRHWFI